MKLWPLTAMPVPPGCCCIALCARWQQPTAVVSLQPRVVDNCWGISATVSLLTLM